MNRLLVMTDEECGALTTVVAERASSIEDWAMMAKGRDGEARAKEAQRRVSLSQEALSRVVPCL